MARRRRNEKSLPELAFGVCMFIVAITMFNPKLREQIFSTVISIVAFLLLIGIIGVAIYLFIQARKADSRPDTFRSPQPVNNVDSLNKRFPNAFKHEENRADGFIIPLPSSNERIPLKSPELSQTELDENKALYKSLYSRKWDVSILRDIEWRRFEKVSIEFLRMSGFVASETKVGADGGVDIRVEKPGVENSAGIVQCKAWNTYKIGIKPIRELFGVMAAERVSTGIFMTSCDFTPEAEEFAKGKITLISGNKFIELISKKSEDDQKFLLDIALDGDYKTPTCPQCDVKMTLRESSKGRNSGGHFWGCIRYPRCKQTLIYKEA